MGDMRRGVWWLLAVWDQDHKVASLEASFDELLIMLLERHVLKSQCDPTICTHYHLSMCSMADGADVSSSTHLQYFQEGVALGHGSGTRAGHQKATW